MSKQINIPHQHNLNNRKWCQHTPNESMDCYRSHESLFYPIKKPNSFSFQSCSCDSKTVWMHHMDANETHGQKTIRELHKNSMCCFEHILEATPHKTAAPWPLTSHLKNHRGKTNKTSRIMLKKTIKNSQVIFAYYLVTMDVRTLLAIKYLLTSVLRGHRVQLRIPSRSARSKEGMVWVNGETLWCQHDMIMIIQNKKCSISVLEHIYVS